MYKEEMTAGDLMEILSDVGPETPVKVRLGKSTLIETFTNAIRISFGPENVDNRRGHVIGKVEVNTPM